MRLEELQTSLVRYGVSLTITEAGKLRPHASEAPPQEVIEAIREHRDALLRQLGEGRLPDGRPDMSVRAALPGHCGTCRHFTLSAREGRYMGVCTLGWAVHFPAETHVNRAVVIHEAASCMTADAPRWAAHKGTEGRA
jgi:hypothetical protein